MTGVRYWRMSYRMLRPQLTQERIHAVEAHPCDRIPDTGVSTHRAMTASSHEGKACDAVLQMLEARAGSARRDLLVDTPRSRGVEVVCTIGAKRYALEHTSIDSYPEKRLDDVQFMAVMGPLAAELNHKGLLRPDCYYSAAVPVRAFAGLKLRDRAGVRDALRAWIIRVAPTCHPEFRGHNLYLSAKPPTVPVPIGLNCTLWPAMGDTFSIARYAPENLEELRRQRLREAIQKKGPKLQAERNAGAVAVLVLEDFDSATSNPVVVGQSVRAELEKSSFAIDEAYLVCTHFPDSWTVFSIKEGNAYWPNAIHVTPRWRDFDSADLSDIMAE